MPIDITQYILCSYASQSQEMPSYLQILLFCAETVGKGAAKSRIDRRRRFIYNVWRELVGQPRGPGESGPMRKVRAPQGKDNG